MEFPIWHLTGINSGMFIAIVAVIHVFVAQFAVGGGIYLVWMERRARRADSPELMDWLERHAKFFLLISMVFGALTGVGIWITISAVNPAATSMLIHNFVFFWAAEWVFFLLEVLFLLAYMYTYPASRNGKMSPETHYRIGLIYAVSGYMSLVLINGIITFMLTPGEGPTTGDIWRAFFNPTFFPSLVLRTGICLVLAGMFALFTTRRIKSPEIRRMTTRASALWIIIPFFLLLAGSAWYFAVLPPTRVEAVLRRTLAIHSFLIAYGWIIPLIFLAGIVAYVRAERMHIPLTILIICLGLGMVGSFEWVRETGRRPWVAEGVMYSNGTTVEQEALAKTQGAAATSGWLRALQEHERGVKPLPFAPATGLSQGSFLFSQQCIICHGSGKPNIDILPRVSRLTEVGFAAQLAGSGKRLTYMLPFAGDAYDRKTLARHLQAMRAAQQRTSSSPTQEKP